MNKELNDLTEQSNNYIIKYKEADKNKKVAEMKLKEEE